MESSPLAGQQPASWLSPGENTRERPYDERRCPAGTFLMDHMEQKAVCARSPEREKEEGRRARAERKDNAPGGECICRVGPVTDLVLVQSRIPSARSLADNVSACTCRELPTVCERLHNPFLLNTISCAPLSRGCPLFFLPARAQRGSLLSGSACIPENLTGRSGLWYACARDYASACSL